MKKLVLILAMMLIAATSYSQSSRKPANTDRTANQREQKSRNTSTQTPSGNQNAERNRSTGGGTNTQSGNREVNRGQTTTSTPRTATNEDNNTGGSVNQNTDRTNNTNTGTTRPDNRNNPDREVVNSNRGGSRYNNTSTGSVNRPVTREYESPRVYRDRHPVSHHYNRPPESREYRSTHYVYRAPVSVNVYWTHTIHHHFLRIYPMVTYWEYPVGYRITMISSYDAIYYRGSVVTVYGRISEIYYSWATDEYFFYFGPYYPYQDFIVVMPGWLARRYSRYPQYFFDNQYMAVTGLITSFDGNPEMVVKETFQVEIY